jgi:hypothetical protein
LMLCGEMFGLAVIRHRIFESPWAYAIEQPRHVKHRGRVAGMRHGEWFEGPYFQVYGEGGGKGTVAQWRQAMSIDWTWNRKSIAEAIPPAYMEYIGNFDLGVQRHRLFESNVSLSAPLCAHERQASLSKKYPVKRYHSGKPKIVMSPVIGVFGRGQGLGPGEVDMWRAAMGISWMVRDELSQAIPPVYTQYIGSQLMNILRGDGV